MTRPDGNQIRFMKSISVFIRGGNGSSLKTKLHVHHLLQAINRCHQDQDKNL
jgi:hypothetical protein